MKTTHTPGPWKAEQNHECQYQIVDPQRTHCLAFVQELEPHCEKLHANARLIAAAPEMLAALEAIEAMLNDHFGITQEDEAGNQQHDMVRAAIAKAKGE